MKYADKIRAEYTVVLGDSELESGVCRVKRMSDGETREVKISDLCGFFR